MQAGDVSGYVFLDECGTNLDMTRRYGRAFGGDRVVDYVPLNTPRNTTIVSSVRMDGSIVYKFFEGALTGEKFLSWLQDDLVPTLKPGDIVIADNLRCHKVEGISEMIAKAKAHIVYLPPYSPDYNPCEPMWSKIKTFLRALKPRSLDSLWTAIPEAFLSVSVSDILAWFVHCGYSELNVKSL